MTVDEALAELLGERRTGDIRADLIMGMNEAMRRRDRNTELAREMAHTPQRQRQLDRPRRP